MQKKRIILLAIFLFSFFTLFAFSPSTAEARKVGNLEGGKFVEGRALVPMRAIFEELGANVVYHPDLKLVHAWNNNVELGLILY